MLNKWNEMKIHIMCHFHLQEKLRLSSILSLPAIVLTNYWYSDGRVDGRPAGRPAYSDIKANSA